MDINTSSRSLSPVNMTSQTSLCKALCQTTLTPYINTTDNPPRKIPTGISTLSQNPHEIVALTFGCAAIILNVLSLLALCQLRRRLTAHHRLISSLALSDMLVGISIVLFIIHKVAHTSYFPGRGPKTARLRARCFFMVVKALNTTSLNISLLNLVGMGLDHYVAISNPLHYTKVMSKMRTNVLIVCLWTIATICGFSDLWTALGNHLAHSGIYNMCEIVWLSPYHEEYSLLCIALVSLILMSLLYISIYRTVSSHRIPGAQYGQEARRNGRALFTTALILGTFMVCWLPLCIFQVVLMLKVKTDPSSVQELKSVLYKADKYLYDLLLLNSLMDPIIYTVRMPDIQLGYKRLFRKCFSQQSRDTSEWRIHPSSSRNSRSRSVTGQSDRRKQESDTKSTQVLLNQEVAEL